MPYLDKERNRQRSRERRRRHTADRQEISARLWPVRNRARRKRALADFRCFCETYFRQKFSKPWSADHLKVIQLMEGIARDGGILPIAMPRGSGKTSLCEALCLFVILAGLREFVLLVGADKGSAVEMLASVKTELESNETLAQDFPREVGPFVLIEGEPRACNGQRYKNRRTHIGWKQNELVFPTIPGSRSSGAVLRVAGITGRVRGQKFVKHDLTSIRPSLVVLDDPQTDKSAKSLGMTGEREQVILGAIKGLAGPGVRLGVLMPCTVVRKGDLAERFLDGKRHPEIRGVRTKMLYSMPSAIEHWDEYRRLYTISPEAARDYYAANRAAMDADAVAAWEHNYDQGELSAIQHAMNWFLFNRAGFFAECQNDPEDVEEKTIRLTVEHLAAKLSGIPAATAPRNGSHLTAYVDVHKEILYWVASAWDSEYGGSIVAYGTWPEQPIGHFAQGNPPLPMSARYAGTEEAIILAGLQDLVAVLVSREWPREDGATLRLGRLLIDTQYKRDVIQSFCRRHQYAALLQPAVGGAIGAKKKPFEEYHKEPGLGLHCIERAAAGERHVWIDTYWWKTFAESRLLLPLGTRGGWEIFGRDPSRHQLLFEHLTAERGTAVTANGRSVREWDVLPNRDNHWWDCLVGSAVAASLLGLRPAGMEAVRGRRKPEDRPTMAQLAGRA